LKGDKTVYAYAVARVRALEINLLDRSKIDRMVEAKDAAEALKVLCETSYSTAASQLANVYDYETILRQEIAAVRELFWKISPHPELTDLFFLRYDVLNLKLLLKAKYLDQDVKDLLIPAGTLSPEHLATIVAEGNWKLLPEELAQAVREIEGLMAEAPDPQQVDTLLDKAHYSYLLRILRQQGEDFLVDLITVQVDLINIRTFVRVRHVAGGDAVRVRELLPAVLIPGGKLKLDFFLGQVEEQLSAFADRFAKEPIGPVVTEGLAAWQREGSLARYEKLMDDFLINYVKKSRLVAFGVEPLVAYLWAKENETKLIRMIMVGKINGLPVDEIRERLRDVYA
jgi:V/A-type H+-transporting ATPase subunit C